jgi:hypothetical protein
MENNFKKDIIGWDVSNWSESLNFFDDNINYANVKKVVELGSYNNSGGYSLFFAEKKIDVTCSGIILPDSKQKSIHRKYSFSSYINYKKIDATDIQVRNEYDIVCMKSLLGRIASGGKMGKVKIVFDEIYKSLKPKGYFVFSENLYSTFIHNYLRKKYKNDGWHYYKKVRLVELLKDSKFQIINYKTNGFIGCFGRNEFQRNILSKFDKYIFNHCIPSNAHYIFNVVLQKN